MSKEEIEKKIYAIVSDILVVPEEKISPTSEFEGDFGADTLDILDLIIEVEGRFGLCIPDCDCEELKTVGQLVDYVVQKLS